MTENRPHFKRLISKDREALFASVPTPAYILDEAALIANGKIIKQVCEDTGAKILLAQKAFSNYDCYEFMAPYMSGTEASGLYEARLGKEEMPDKEVHVFCGAYRESDFPELFAYADHIVFNSPAQFKKYAKLCKENGKSIGLRINPEFSTQEGHAIYDPCAPGGRLGTTRAAFDAQMDAESIALLDGLHFHTLCEQNSDDLETTLQAVAEKFGDILKNCKWVNFGGGHHITRVDYDIETLEKCIRFAQDTWGVEVYLEPGEAWALNAGYLITHVLDTPVNGEVKLAILDASAACHMPDVIEMPYLPPIFGAETIEEDEPKSGIRYRLGGPTCLSGDVIGDYAFDRDLKEGDLLVFGDMAIYTTCKNNTFNGMPLPDIYLLQENDEIRQLTHFGYDDFKMRLGSRR
ncbi:MAG: carboxynorspermidine decarboxylase [Acetatifactor sp.]|nr:carboxynorspermidine decarboxylase [Acetatifactor sp.]